MEDQRSKVWRHFGNKKPIQDDVISYVKKQIELNPNIKITVGTDSTFSKGLAKYQTVIAFRNVGKGATGIYLETHQDLYYKPKERGVKQKAKKFGETWVVEERLRYEKTLTVEIGLLLKNNGIRIECVELDYNQNPKYLSNRVIAEGVAEAKGYFSKVISKNEKGEPQCSAVFADKLLRN